MPDFLIVDQTQMINLKEVGGYYNSTLLAKFIVAYFQFVKVRQMSGHEECFVVAVAVCICMRTYVPIDSSVRVSLRHIVYSPVELMLVWSIL